MSNLIYGVHAVEGLIKNNAAEKVFVVTKDSLGKQLEKVVSFAQKKNVELELLKDVRDLPERAPRGVNHQNIFAYEKQDNQKIYSDKDIESLLPQDKNAFILILDSVQDPHNLGACIRSAHSAGVDFIMMPKDNSVSVNATVKKVACGAAEHTKIVVVTNLARSMEKLKKEGVWLVGLAGEATDNLYDMNLSDSIALVAGSEGKGMRQKTKNTCDFLAKLPMYGEVSSLNVSVAAGVSMYEAVRQRLK